MLENTTALRLHLLTPVLKLRCRAVCDYLIRCRKPASAPTKSSLAPKCPKSVQSLVGDRDVNIKHRPMRLRPFAAPVAISCPVFNHLRSEVWLHCEQLVSVCRGLVHLTTLPSWTFQSNPQCYLSMTSLVCLFSVSVAISHCPI